MRLLDIVAGGVLGDTLVLFFAVVLVGSLIKGGSLAKALGHAVTVVMGWIMVLVGLQVILAALGAIDNLLAHLVVRSGKGIHKAAVDPLFNGRGGYAHAQAIAVLLAYGINLLWARLSRAKYLFLNPLHVLLGTAVFLVLFWRASISPIVAVPVVAALVGSAMAWLPWLSRSRANLMSPESGVTLGSWHTGALLGIALLAPRLGGGGHVVRPDTDAPGLRSPIIVSGIVVGALAVLLAINAGEGGANSAISAVRLLALLPAIGSRYYLVGALIIGLIFAVGLWIVVDAIPLVLEGVNEALAGLRKGIPGLQPALDALFMLDEAPRTAVIGFLLSLGGATLGYYLFGWLGLGVVVPGMLVSASAGHLIGGGAAAIVAERLGGRRALWILVPAHGFILSLLVALAYDASAGLGRARAGAVVELSDLAVIDALISGILRLFS
jgi:PTS system ascorbate-specific IIC component